MPQAVSLTSIVLPQMIALPQMTPWFHVTSRRRSSSTGTACAVSHHCPVGVEVSIDRARSMRALGVQRAGALSQRVVLDAEVVVNADRRVLQDRFHGVRRQRAGCTGFAARFASSISAIEPLVTAVAMLVPLRRM